MLCPFDNVQMRSEDKKFVCPECGKWFWKDDISRFFAI